MSGAELHEMFIEEPDDESLVEDLDDMQIEQPGEVSSEGSVQLSVAAPRSRRQLDSSPRHKCTLVDPNTGDPCNADFSRAG